jgi:hypothetical protein
LPLVPRGGVPPVIGTPEPVLNSPENYQAGPPPGPA